jgi:hypothetical protein
VIRPETSGLKITVSSERSEPTVAIALASDDVVARAPSTTVGGGAFGGAFVALGGCPLLAEVPPDGETCDRPPNQKDAAATLTAPATACTS